jgi:hypothetical protein
MDQKEIGLALSTLGRLERLYKQGTDDNDVFLLRRVEKLYRRLYDTVEARLYDEALP